MSNSLLFSIKEVEGDFKLSVYKDLPGSTLEYHKNLEHNLEKVYELLTCVLDLNDPEKYLEIYPKSYSFDNVKAFLYNYHFKNPFRLAVYEYKKSQPFNTVMKGKVFTLFDFIERIHIGGMFDSESNTFIHPDRVGLFYIDSKEEHTFDKDKHYVEKYKLYDWKG